VPAVPARQPVSAALVEADVDVRHEARRRVRPVRLDALLSAHHDIPRVEGGADHPSNLEALCARCHRAETAREQAEQRRHPG